MRLFSMFLAGAVSLIALAGSAKQTLVVRNQNGGQEALGFFVFAEGQSGSWSSTYMVVAKDRGKTKPSVYLTYAYSPSDVMPPWTSSEYKGIRNESGKIEVKDRSTLKRIIEFSGAKRAVDGLSTMNTSCGVYEENGTKLVAYCPSSSDSNAFTLKDTSGNLLVSFSKKNGDEWTIVLENSATDSLAKSIAIMLAGLKMWR